MGILENIAIAILAAALITVIVFIIVRLWNSDFLNFLHIAGLIFLFVFTGIQTYLFCAALDEKEFINTEVSRINAMTQLATDYMSQSEDGQYLLENLKENPDFKALDAVLNFMGIQIDSDNTLISTEALDQYYNNYLWKRVGWIATIMALYILICLVLTPRSTNSTTDYSYGNGSSIDTSDWQNY